MARINFPINISGWVKLFRKVKPSVLALPAPNQIDTYMTENEVVLADDETALNAAEAADTLADEKEREAETHTKAANLLYKPCAKDHRKCAQALKSIYRTNPRKLGDWGITVNNVSKIVYAENITEHAVEMKALITQHNTYAPGTSPLKSLLEEEGIDLAQNNADVDSALIEYGKADAANALKEEKIKERDLKIHSIIEHLHGIGQAAVKMYVSNPKKAGALGFRIDDSPRAARVAEHEVNPGEEKEFAKLKNNTYLTNLTDFPIKVRAANKPPEEAVIVQPYHSLKIERGYGKIIVTNTNDTKKAKFEAEFNP